MALARSQSVLLEQCRADGRLRGSRAAIGCLRDLGRRHAAVAFALAVAAVPAGCGGNRLADDGKPCRAIDVMPRPVDVGTNAAGVAHAAITLTNTGVFTCRLSGVPTLALVGRSRRPQYTPPQVSSGNRGLVTLLDGQTASFWLQALAPNGFPVPGARYVAIALRGVVGRVDLPVTLYLKTRQQLIVSAIAPGVVSAPPSSVSPAAPCTVRSITFRTHLLGVAMPGGYAVDILTNSGTRACSLGGVPKLTFLHDRLRTLPDSGSQITIGPGAHASFWVFGPECVAPGRQRCQPSASAIVGGVYEMAPGFTQP